LARKLYFYQSGIKRQIFCSFSQI